MRDVHKLKESEAVQGRVAAHSLFYAFGRVLLAGPCPGDGENEILRTYGVVLVRMQRLKHFLQFANAASDTNLLLFSTQHPRPSLQRLNSKQARALLGCLRANYRPAHM